MNDCTRAVFYPSEEGAKFKIMFGESPNSQKHRRSSKLCKPDFKPSQTVQQNCVEFHYWQNWQTDSWIILSRLVAPTANLLTTDVLRLCIMCGNNNAIADQAWATELSEAWDPTTFFDKYDIMGRPMQFHWYIFQATQRSKSRERFKHSWDPRNRVISKEE